MWLLRVSLTCLSLQLSHIWNIASRIAREAKILPVVNAFAVT